MVKTVLIVLAACAVACVLWWRSVRTSPPGPLPPAGTIVTSEARAEASGIDLETPIGTRAHPENHSAGGAAEARDPEEARREIARDQERKLALAARLAPIPSRTVLDGVDSDADLSALNEIVDSIVQRAGGLSQRLASVAQPLVDEKWRRGSYELVDTQTARNSDERQLEYTTILWDASLPSNKTALVRIVPGELPELDTLLLERERLTEEAEQALRQFMATAKRD